MRDAAEPSAARTLNQEGLIHMRKFYRSAATLVVAGTLVGGLAACAPQSNTSSVPPGTGENSNSAEATPEPVATIEQLDGVDTQVTLDAGFVEAITSLGLTPGVLGGATLTDGVLAFPITGGNVDYYDPEQDYRPYVQGSIEHEGSGISLTSADGTVVELTDFVIDPGTSQLLGTVTANGEVAGENVFIFNLDGTTLNPLTTDDAGNAVLEGTTVLISEDAAPLLNETFGTDAVTDELVVGIAKITAGAAS
jgi:filamentous hemagglutinin family protein